MMYMQRTQIYLGPEEVELLEEASRRTGATKSSLIRMAVRRQYGRPNTEARIADLVATAGLWSDRAESAADYVDEVRAVPPAKRPPWEQVAP